MAFCHQAKVSKPYASYWSRRSVKSVFSRDNPTLMISVALFGLILHKEVFTTRIVAAQCDRHHMKIPARNIRTIQKEMREQAEIELHLS